MLTRLLPSLAILSALISTVPQAHADPADKLARLFELTRVEETLRGYPDALLEGMDETTEWGGVLEREKVMALAEKHFRSDVLTADLMRVLTGQLSSPLLDREIAFFETGFGQRIVEFEVVAADPALEETVDREGGRIYRDLVGADSPRVALIQRLIEGMALIDWGMATGMNLGYAMLTALLGEQMSDDQIIATINANIGGMRPELVRMANAFAAYTYRDLSDAELERYVMRFESPQGRMVTKAVMDAYRIVLVERSRAFGYDLRTLAGQRRG